MPWGARHPFPPLAAAPPWRSHLPGPAQPPRVLYKGGGGRAATHSLGRLPPPLQHLSLSQKLGEALPETRYIHHHAVVLTELIPEALLDRSPGIVIELNVC